MAYSALQMAFSIVPLGGHAADHVYSRACHSDQSIQKNDHHENHDPWDASQCMSRFISDRIHISISNCAVQSCRVAQTFAVDGEEIRVRTRSGRA
jgi:hypothetical protein